MLDWVSNHVSELLAASGVVGGLLVFAWKLLCNWLQANYVPRKEIEERLNNLQKDFAEDLKISSDAGMELSRFMQAQIKILQTALLMNKGSNND